MSGKTKTDNQSKNQKQTTTASRKIPNQNKEETKDQHFYGHDHNSRPINTRNVSIKETPQYNVTNSTSVEPEDLLSFYYYIFLISLFPVTPS